MVEYASVTSAVALIAVALAGFQAKIVAALPTSTATAVALAAKTATGQAVSSAGAREAARTAPYRKPALKYLYAAGWVAGVKKPVACRLTALARDTSARYAADALRRDARARAQLGKLGITVATASRVVTAGMASACP